MKYIFTLLFGGLFTSAAFASNITLSFAGGRSYQVLIDGRAVSTGDYYRNTVYLNDLRYGSHTLEVYRMRRHGWGWNNSSSQLTYSSSFRVAPQLDLDIQIDDRGRAFLNESRCGDRNQPGDRDDHKGYDQGNWGRDDHGGFDRNDNRGGYTPGNNGGYDGNNNGAYNNGSYNRAMNDMDFNSLLQRIRGQWMGKMNTARDAINGNYFTGSQVRQLLQIFTSERDRLGLAKLAYSRMVDQQNFRQLYDLFSYQGQSELDDYTHYGR